MSKKLTANEARRVVVIRWRKKLKLCEKCGLDIHSNECIEDYTKADMRKKEEKIINLNKKKMTVISYRKKKKLCLNCGKDVHEGLCIEDFTQSDNRDAELKRNDPRIILTPKEKVVSTIEELTTQEPIQVQTLDFEIIKPKYTRPYVVVDLKNSSKDDVIDFTVPRYLSKKFQNYIICCIGSLDQYFKWNEALQLKKITNILEVKFLSERNIVSHIQFCNLFLSFSSKYTKYAKENKIPVYIFQEGKTVTSSDIRITKNY